MLRLNILGDHLGPEGGTKRNAVAATESEAQDTSRELQCAVDRQGSDSARARGAPAAPQGPPGRQGRAGRKSGPQAAAEGGPAAGGEAGAHRHGGSNHGSMLRLPWPNCRIRIRRSGANRRYPHILHPRFHVRRRTKSRTWAGRKESRCETKELKAKLHQRASRGIRHCESAA